MKIYSTQKAEDPKQNKVASFLPFLGSSQPATPLPTPSPNTLWLALITLELEHEIVELQTQLWPELLRQMEGAALKCSIDNLIKVYIPVFTGIQLFTLYPNVLFYPNCLFCLFTPYLLNVFFQSPLEIRFGPWLCWLSSCVASRIQTCESDNSLC